MRDRQEKPALVTFDEETAINPRHVVALLRSGRENDEEVIAIRTVNGEDYRVVPDKADEEDALEWVARALGYGIKDPHGKAVLLSEIY